MRSARVFVDFAEEILAVNEVQWATEEPAEIESQALQVSGLRIDHVANDLLFDAVRSRPETLSDAVLRTGPGDHKFVLVAVHKGRVVEVDRELESEEPTERWERR